MATLRAFKPITTSKDDFALIVQFWKEIIQSASDRSDWPKEKLVLELENAQLGSNAGILLWRERKGCLKTMRNCLRREVNYYKEILDTLISSTVESCASIQHKLLRETLNAFTVPDIVHTSFLRFIASPKTDGQVVQTRFGHILSKNISIIDDQDKLESSHELTSTINQLFEENIEIAKVNLVIEYYPYKLFPSDRSTVIWDYNLK